MRTIEGENGVKVYVFASDKEMPAKRYSLFQKYLLMDAGVGSDLASVSAHMTRLYGYVAEDMKDEALKECENLHMNFYTVIEGINFASLAFACIVAKIDDELQTDISEEGLKRLSDIISDLGLTQGTVEETIQDVKKKIGEALKLYFPRLFPDESLPYYEKLKQRILLQGELMLMEDKDDPQIQARLKEISRFFLEQSAPQSYRADDPENCAIVLEKSFSQLAAVLGNNGAPNAEEMPVFDFYSRLDYLSKPDRK